MANLFNNIIFSRTVFGSLIPWYLLPPFNVADEPASLALDFERNRASSNRQQVDMDEILTYTRSGDHTFIDAFGNRRTAGPDERPTDYSQGFAALPRFLAKENLCPEPVTPFSGWNNVLATLSPAPEDMQDYFTDGVVIASGGASFHRKNSDTFSWTSGETYLISLFLKEGTSGRLGVVLGDDTAGTQTVAGGDFGNDLSVFLSNAGTLTTFDKKDLGDGFWEYYIEFIPNSTTSAGRLGVGPSTSTTGLNVVFYGAQVEENTFPTPFTIGTRFAPNIQITGNEFTKFYNQTEGTIEIEFYQPYSVETLRRYFAVAGASGNDFNVYTGGNDIPIYNASTDSVNQINQGTGVTGKDEVTQRIIITYKDNDSAIFQTDGDAQIDNSCTIAKVMTALSIGDTTNNDRGHSFWVRRVTVWNKAFSVDELVTTFDYVIGGDSYLTGKTGESIGRVLKLRGYDNYNTAIGGSTLEQAVQRIEALTFSQKLIFGDGSNNGYDAVIANDVARYQRAFDAANGNIIILSCMLHPTLVGTAQGQAALDLSAALVTQFGPNVIDLTAIARAQSGVTFTDPTDASDPGYSNAAYTALFSDGVHPSLDFYTFLADIVEAEF